jgi:hypothetical protein
MVTALEDSHNRVVPVRAFGGNWDTIYMTKSIQFTPSRSNSHLPIHPLLSSTYIGFPEQITMGENRGPQLIGVNSFMLVFSWIFVGMRCYCRIFMARSFGVDDCFCLLAQVQSLPTLSFRSLADMAQLLFTISCAFSLTCVVYGVGQPTADIQPPSNIPIILKVIPSSKYQPKLHSSMYYSGGGQVSPYIYSAT